MGDGASLDGDVDGGPPGHGGSLAHRVRDGQRLAHAGAHASLAVANHHQGVEPEATTALDHLGDASGVHHSLVHASAVVLALALFPVAATTATASATIGAAFAAPAAGVASWASTGCWGNHQNTSPPSRAASARALTRPWNW